MKQYQIVENNNQNSSHYQNKKELDDVLGKEQRRKQQFNQEFFAQEMQIGNKSQGSQIFKQLYEIIENNINIIQMIVQDILKVKQYVLMKFDQINYLSEQWIRDLQEITNIKMEIKGNNELFDEKREFEIQNNQINSSYQRKIMRAIKQMKKIIQQNSIEIQLENNLIIYQGLKNLDDKEQQAQQNNSVCYQLLSQMNQQEICYSLAFNYNGTIMVSGCQENIKIWKFNGRMIDCLQIIKGDSDIDYATCLVFSKKSNSFISGSFDTSIKIYKEQNNIWNKSICYFKHDGVITCVILSNQEDQLISSSQDHYINIWKIDFIQNSLQFQYSLKRHEKVIFSLIINKQDTELISTSLDKKIIIWNKDANQKWCFNYLIDHPIDDYGCTISYITDSIIAWQQSHQPYIHFFQQENGIYIEKQQLRLELPNISDETNLFSFPNIFNFEKQILILKYNQMIHFISYEEKTFQFQFVSKPIQLSNNSIYGNLSQDGKYLGFWDYKMKQYSIYELQYQ
ncbi:unnamed protein product [Paramecium sonneborni]|uniref:WD40-repeat-containing domain n=1 Tax=Paramecium sonneborni TaxID=65129 RepID=A0A8S1R8J0_9CILI|nr:unnamed protein product [Paramecium sonneborni]